MKVGVLVQFTSKTDIEAKFTELKELGVLGSPDPSRRCDGREDQQGH